MEYIYFYETNDVPSYIYLGTSVDVDARGHARKGWVRRAVMPNGGRFVEKTIAEYFKSDWVPYRDKYTIRGEKIKNYVDRLLLIGYAGKSVEEADKAERPSLSERGPAAVLDVINHGLLPGSRTGPVDYGEWYTPAPLVALATRALGGTIYTDPCASLISDRTVLPKLSYTKTQNGLRANNPWVSNAFIHPPYYGEKEEGFQQFMERTLAEYASGNIVAAIVFCSTSTPVNNYFNTMGVYKKESCHLIWSGRPEFVKAEDLKPRHSSQLGLRITYFGAEPALFHDVFAPYGAVYRPWRKVFP